MSSFYPATAHKSIMQHLLLGLISGVLVVGGLFYVINQERIPEIARAQTSCGTCSDTVPLDLGAGGCDIYWSWEKTFTVHLDHAPVSGETLTFDFKGYDSTPCTPPDDCCSTFKCVLLGSPATVNGHSNVNSETQLCGDSIWRQLILPADLDGGGVDWVAGDNLVTLGLGGYNCWLSGDMIMEQFKCPGVANHTPTASMTPDSPAVESPPVGVTFTLDGTDPEGISSWSLDCCTSGSCSGDANGSGDPNGLTRTCTYNDYGTYTAKLTITDTDGAAASDTSTVKVKHDLVVPTACFQVYYNDTGEEITKSGAGNYNVGGGGGATLRLDAACSSADAEQFRWFDEDRANCDGTAGDPDCWTNWATGKIYTETWTSGTGWGIRLEVKDQDGDTNQSISNINKYILGIYKSGGTFTGNAPLGVAFDLWVQKESSLGDWATTYFSVDCRTDIINEQTCHSAWAIYPCSNPSTSKCISTGPYTGGVICEDFNQFLGDTADLRGNMQCNYSSAGDYNIKLRVEKYLSDSEGYLTYQRIIPVTVTAPPIPAVPAGLTHTGNTTTSIDWDWSDVSGATYYELWDGGCTWTKQGALVSSNTTEGVGTPNTLATSKVKACNASGCSACSAAAAAYTSIQSPTGITCSAITDTSITVAAQGTISNLSLDSSGIKFREPDGKNSGWIQTVTYNFTGLTSGTNYNFYAQTKNGNGDPADEFGPISCSTLPASPTWATPNHTGNTTTSIDWDWNAATGATYYQVYNGGSCSGGVLQTVNAPATNWDESGLSANTNYTRTLKACNAAGCSACSAAAAAYTSASMPISLSGTVPAGVDGRTKINWSWASGGAQKEFYASDSAGNTGWTTSTTWNQTGLTCNTSYTLKVKARNGDNDETAEASSLIVITHTCNRAPYWSPVIPDTTAQEGTLKTYDVSGYAKDDDIAGFGDVLTCSKIAGPGSVSAACAFTWTPGYIEAGVYSVTVRVSDGLLTAEDTFQITVSDVNVAPVLEPIGPQSIDEGQALTFTVYATDEEGSQANLIISELGNGDFIFDAFCGSSNTCWDNGQGKWRRTYQWVPSFTSKGNHNVTFTATDRQGATDSETITITVSNVNHTPSITQISDITKIEGDTVSFDVVITDQYDTDDTETISYTISQQPKGGSTIAFVSGSYSLGSGCVNQGGNLQCTISFSWPTNYYDDGVYDLTFKAKDNYGAEANEPVKITINNNNRTNLTITLSGTEPITVSEQTQVTFTVTATDTDKDDTINFTINNKPSNALYPIDKQGQTTQTNFKLGDDECLINVQDKLECAVTFTWTPGWTGDTNPYDGLPAGVPTDYTPSFGVNDGLGGSASASKTIKVSDTNRALSCSKLTNIQIGGVPQAERPMSCEQSTSFTIDENQALLFTFQAVDPDTDNILTYWCVNSPTGAVCTAGGDFSWTPSYDQAGNYSFKFWATDAITSSDYITVNVTVNDVNRAPYFNPQPADFTAIEGTQKIYTVNAYDDDGDVLTYTYSFAVNPPGGDTAIIPKISNNQADYKWKPAYIDGGYPAQSRNFSLTFKVEDDGSTLPKKSVTKTIVITVYDYNRQPTMDNISNQQVLENQLLQFTVVTADADSDNVLTHTITTPNNPNHPGAVIDNPTKKISWTPAFDFITNIEDASSESTLMTVKVDDGSYQPQTISGGGASNISKSTTITVLDVNRAPQYVDAVESKEIEEGLNLTFNIEVSDIDGDAVPIDYSWMLMQNGNPLPTGKPGADDDIKYPVSAVPSGGYPNKTTLAFSWAPSEDQGGANPSICKIDYPLRVYAKDDIKNRARTTPLPVNEPITITKDITIAVYNKNQAPVITDPSDGSVEENKNFNLNIQATDPDPADQLTYSIVSVNPAYIDPNNPATINSQNGAFSWEPNYVQAGAVDRNPPNREYWNEYTFTVKAEDNFDCPGGKKSDTASFKVKVLDKNQAPGLSDNTGAYEEIIEQIAGSFSLINNDPDSDNTFIYTYSTAPDLPAVDLAPKGIFLSSPIIAPNKNSLFQWTPTYNQAYYNAAGTALQAYTFTFTVDDQRAASYSDSHNVAIKIVDANRAPVFEMVASPLTMSENGTLDIIVKARDNDWDYYNNRGDKIKFSLTGYTLTAQEVPLDDGSASLSPFAANLQIIGQLPIDPEDITDLVISGTPIDLGTLASDCQIYAGPPAYTECQQILKVNLEDMYDHMGWHTFTFAATDVRSGDDIDYAQDDPKISTYPLLVQVSNVNRAPEAPVPIFPDDDPAFQDHNLVLEPQYDPTDLDFTFDPKGDPDVWAHQDTVTYTLYIKEFPDGAFTAKGAPIVLDASIVAPPALSQTINVNNLSSRTDYEWYIEARDDAPCKTVTPTCTTLGVLSTNSPHFKFRTGMVNCTDGRECRKGEICYDDDNDDGTFRVCKNFDECDQEGADCYLSACPSGQVEDNPGQCLTLAENPSKRKHHDSQGKCSAIIGNRCDLPAAKANTPEACKGDGSECRSNVNLLESVDVSPRFQWTDSDPPETWDDYKGASIGYLGTQTRYKFYIDNDKATDTFDYFHPPDHPPFDWSLADLDYRPVNEVNRLFSFTDMTGEYLNFNEAYAWKVEADTDDQNPNVESPTWQFTTKSVCDILEYSYWFDGQSFPYNPDNMEDAPDGPLPVGVELRWPPEDYYLVNDILKGPGPEGQALYDLRLQECNLAGTICQPIEPNIGVSGDWGYVLQAGQDYFYSFNTAPLNYSKMYVWQTVVHHGRFGEEIETECPIDGNFFITPEPPGVDLTKSTIAVSESQITYQIDFTVTGEPWQRITDFYIRDNFPNFVDEAFNYTFLGDVDAAYSDDKLIRRDPQTLYIDSSLRDYDRDSYIKWYIKDTEGDGSLKAGDSGSLKITLDQDPDIAGHVEAGECIWLTNEVYAGGIDERCVIEPCSDEFKFNTGENPVFSPAYLAGTENIDKSFLSSQQGNIHSNVNICLQNQPPSALDVYTGDYFITTGREENVPEDWLRKGGDYRKTNFFLEEVENVDIQTVAPNEIKIIITKTNSEEEVLMTVETVEEDGVCDVDSLFAGHFSEGNLNLGGKVFLCRAGNLIINRELVINNQGGYGTVIVEGDLHIKDDIYYSNDTIDDINKLASLGWIVLGNVKIEKYDIVQASGCDPYPQSKWCTDYKLVVDPDEAGPLPPELAYGPITVGPVHIVGTFLVIGEIVLPDQYVGGNFYTGEIHLPLQVEGSIIANKVVLQRKEFPD